MRIISAGILGIITIAALFLMSARTSHSQRPQATERPQAIPPGAPQPSPEGGRSPRRGAGGFPFPAPPVLTALDKNNDGELDAEELEGATAALHTLDTNRDGELAGRELLPAMGPGRGPFGEATSQDRVEPEKINFTDGVAKIPDMETFHKLSYKGEQVMIDTFLAGLEFIKFTFDQAKTDNERFYFINTVTHRAHMMFARAAGLPFGRGVDQMKGVLVYRPMLEAPNGRAGLFTFEFEPFDAYSFQMVQHCYNELLRKMPELRGRLGYFPRGARAIAQVRNDRKLYDVSEVRVYMDEDLNATDVAFLPLNHGTSFGRLRVMQLDGRPGPRDIVLYRSLPNEMPRVAGIITGVRQTPLSHVNLRAIQDKIPNAFVRDAADDPVIKPLVGKLVAYAVTPEGYSLREATRAEVESHFAKSRPAEPQLPPRDLSIQEIRPLEDVVFNDSQNVGVKAANLAVLRTFGFPGATVPDGFAVPFYFYHEFMKHNGFYKFAAELMANTEFQQDRQTQVEMLAKFRSLIKKGKMPAWMMRALEELHHSFPEGSSVRCRSSTNNEDLPGFSGAGLYDSYTHHPREGHFSKSIKQVYASLWNFRAFEEREFYRVDHLQAAMGVLVHRNFKDEKANGVAVTSDILYQTDGNYYLNTQVGEDLVTNPEDASIPEELLLDWWDSSSTQMMRSSNRSAAGRPLLSRDQLEQLRDHLGTIHAKFATLYGKSLEDDRFAMEVEFKITSGGALAIKQVRPWVFSN